MRNFLTALAVVFALTLALPAIAEAHQPTSKDCWHYAHGYPHSVRAHYESCMWWRVRHIGKHYRHLAHPSVKQAKFIICSYWKRPGLCVKAWIVAWKESSFYWGATNGQYCSVYQMGTSERATYGGNPCHHGGNNIRAAYNYDGGGARFGPWQCKPTLSTSDGCKSVPAWVLRRP
jgi:hypothetical protein